MSTPLNIDAMNDFAFMKSFGTKDRHRPLISLINSILELPHPVVRITILNPFNYQDFIESKRIAMDILAVDESGAIFNIEMQTTTPKGLKKRSMHYACLAYTNQLKRGMSYQELKPVYSIWILKNGFPDEEEGLSRYNMHNQVTKKSLSDAISIYYLALDKYNLSRENVGRMSDLEKWIFWLKESRNFSYGELVEMFSANDGILDATESMHKINVIKEDKIMYDAIEKFKRDRADEIYCAKEEGKAEGIAVGKAEGIAVGKIGTIRTLESIYSNTLYTDDDLKSKTIEELDAFILDLQLKIRNRYARDSK